MPVAATSEISRLYRRFWRVRPPAVGTSDHSAVLCTGENAGYWYRAGKCFVGNDFRITLGPKVAKLPERAIVAVSYNTSDYGVEPQRPKPCNSSSARCPYDLLFVGFNLTLKVNEKGEYEVNEKGEFVREPVSPSVGARRPAPSGHRTVDGAARVGDGARTTSRNRGLFRSILRRQAIVGASGSRASAVSMSCSENSGSSNSPAR
jgi:hypothetical protein